MYPTQAMTHLVPLAVQDLDENKVTPGVLGFIVFAVLALGVWQLMKSMNRHMNRVDFKEAPDRSGSQDDMADDMPEWQRAAAGKKPARTRQGE